MYTMEGTECIEETNLMVVDTREDPSLGKAQLNVFVGVSNIPCMLQHHDRLSNKTLVLLSGRVREQVSGFKSLYPYK